MCLAVPVGAASSSANTSPQQNFWLVTCSLLEISPRQSGIWAMQEHLRPAACGSDSSRIQTDSVTPGVKPQNRVFMSPLHNLGSLPFLAPGHLAPQTPPNQQSLLFQQQYALAGTTNILYVCLFSAAGPRRTKPNQTEPQQTGTCPSPPN